jgi:hypothetical protein
MEKRAAAAPAVAATETMKEVKRRRGRMEKRSWATRKACGVEVKRLTWFGTVTNRTVCQF